MTCTDLDKTGLRPLFPGGPSVQGRKPNFEIRRKDNCLSLDGCSQLDCDPCLDMLKIVLTP